MARRKAGARKVGAKRRKTTVRKKASRRTASRRPKAKPKPKPKPKAKAKKRASAPRKKAKRVRRAARSSRQQVPRARLDPSWKRGMGAESAGQAGDTQRISRGEVADSESVEELLEEGQAFEAGVVDGVENAPDADQGEVRTREVPEDDVPQEYLDED
jgi:hypothetical protein